MKCRITNNSNLNMGELSPLIDDLASHIQDVMKFKSMPAITMQDDDDNADVLLGKTAQYDPQNKVITVFVSKRHPKDIMRSIAHEFIHHAQNERGEFDTMNETSPGYAQTDKHLRNMEKEAYLQGNMCFRDWEDGYKNNLMESIHRQNSFKRRNNTMKIHKWKNNELNKLLMEKFNFGGKKEYDLEEGADRIFAPNHYCAHHVVHEGLEAYTVDHNWDEKLQEVTEYDIRFRDGTVKRNVSINELEVLEAFQLNEHGGDMGNRDDDKKHPKVKKAKNEEEEKQLQEMDRSEEMFYYLKSKMPEKSDEEIMQMVYGYNKDTYAPRKASPPLEEKQFANSDELDADKDGVPKWADKNDKDASVGSKGSKKKGKKEKQEESFRDSVRKLMEEIIGLQ